MLDFKIYVPKVTLYRPLIINLCHRLVFYETGNSYQILDLVLQNKWHLNPKI